MNYIYTKDIKSLSYLSYLIIKQIPGKTLLGVTNTGKEIDNIIISFENELNSEELVILNNIIENLQEKDMTNLQQPKNLTKLLNIKKEINENTFTEFFKKEFNNKIYLEHLQFDFDSDNIEINIELDNYDYFEEPLKLTKNLVKEYFTYNDYNSKVRYSIENGRCLVRIIFDNYELNNKIVIKARSLAGNQFVTLKFLVINYYQEVWREV